jgi:hypothetical protein
VRTARAIFTNAVGPVSIYVVADARASVTRRIRVRRSMTAIGSLVAQRNLRATFAIPVDRLTGS